MTRWLHRAARGIRVPGGRLLAVGCLTVGLATPIDAQDTTAAAITYLVRSDDPTVRSGFSPPPRPLRVVQGPVFTWLLEEPDDRPSLGSALWVLQHNTPVEPGPNGLLVRGWSPGLPQGPDDSVSVTLGPGTYDRHIAGRAARHHQLRAVIQRSDTATGIPRTTRVTADLWMIPDLPFTWAPFGPAEGSLPVAYPRLRNDLEPRLAALGLVARAVIRVDERVTGFEISDLRRTEAPSDRSAPAPIVDRALVDAAERLTARRPLRVCDGARDGELPAVMRARVDDDLRGPLVDLIASACRSPELYLSILERRFPNDREGLCRTVRYAYSPRDLARELFDDDQRHAFREYLPPREQARVLDELRRSCPEP